MAKASVHDDDFDLSEVVSVNKEANDGGGEDSGALTGAAEGTNTGQLKLEKSSYNLRRVSDGRTIMNVPPDRIVSDLPRSTRALILILFLGPCVVLIPLGLLLLDVSYLPFGLGLWNGAIGASFLLALFFKRLEAESKILEGNTLDGFWVKYPSQEQGFAIVVSLVVYMSGVSVLSQQYFYPDYSSTRFIAIVLGAWYIFGPLIAVYLGGRHCRRVLYLSSAQVRFRSVLLVSFANTPFSPPGRPERPRGARPRTTILFGEGAHRM